MSAAPLRLTSGQMAAFARDGFLVVRNVVNVAALRALRRAFAARVEHLLQCHRQPPAGGFAENIIRLLSLTPDSYEHIDISLPMISDMASRVDKWRATLGDDWRQMAGVFADDALFNVMTHPNIVNIARQFLGEEIVASPVQHVRIKPPQRLLPAERLDSNVINTLWHQDEAVVSESARGADILTVWVALTDATRENGCMRAVAASHTAADLDDTPDYGLTAHCPGKTGMVAEIYIPDEKIDAARLVDLTARAGDVVLLHKRTVHGAGVNRSSQLRWSLDLRYQPAGSPSGRECFPSTLVASAQTPQAVVKNAADYRHRWLRARDDIISGKVKATFNERWEKYGGAPLCA